MLGPCLLKEWIREQERVHQDQSAANIRSCRHILLVLLLDDYVGECNHQHFGSVIGKIEVDIVILQSLIAWLDITTAKEALHSFEVAPLEVKLGSASVRKGKHQTGKAVHEEGYCHNDGAHFVAVLLFLVKSSIVSCSS